MYDNITKLYKLENINSKIESLDTTIDGEVLTLHLKLLKDNINCPQCQTYPMYFHGFRLKKLIHSVSLEHQVKIAYYARHNRCKTFNKTIYETNPFNQVYERISLKTKLSILNHLKDIHHNFADTAKLFNVSSQSVINIFDKHIDAHPRKLGEVISIDEVFTNKMNKYKYACVILDFNTSKIIDIIATRHKNYLTEYFFRIPREERLGVKAVVIDMWLTYYDVAKFCFPNAFIAIDSFHIIKNLNEAIKQIRIQIQRKYDQDSSRLEYNDMYYYMLKKFHYFFVKDYENIYDGKIRVYKMKGYWHKSEILSYLLKIDNSLTKAYRLKEAYRVFNLTASFNDCDERLDELITEFRNSEFEIYRTFGQTLNTWRDSIKNSFIRIDVRRISNGPIESINNKIKTIIKNSNGIRYFYRFRNKVLYSINKDVPITNK
ncbi:Transposase and inactivated derivatives [Acholeplasma oculi]|uniref:Transposase IS204/IS1001/IS1096/IS1165 n=1 Tax=Acholeplasma oculi TaxID=35623 RepID=A0A061AFZ3_9MOLU|nr:ISL3 family transposase [Acholeplasma oculi]CDR30496.1 Transposase IS204/IS1001/IS1096/IS1165 [Acholeplasma oculi]SKC47946.1 Transposase [Acholeplasma oculi]SUT89131.1 Transposase and inactivated derivatives [Acholeplasma oculi]